MLVLSYHQEKWLLLTRKLVDFRFCGEPKDYRNTCRTGNICTVAYLLYLTVGLTFYSVNQYVLGKKCSDPALKTGYIFCGTLEPLWLPFDVDQITLKWIFAFQILACAYVLYAGASAVMITFQATRFIIMHLNHFKAHLINIYGYEREDEKKNAFKFCVRYHNHILG